jgi:hypothetical protein
MATLDGMSSDERRMYIREHNESHLIRFVGQTEPEALEDLLLIMAKNVESAMITAGAEPGKDYTYQGISLLSRCRLCLRYGEPAARCILH